MGYIYLVLPVTGLLMIYFSAVNIYHTLSNVQLDAGNPAGGVVE